MVSLHIDIGEQSALKVFCYRLTDGLQFEVPSHGSPVIIEANLVISPAAFNHGIDDEGADNVAFFEVR